MNGLRAVTTVLFDCDGVLCPSMRFADRLARDHGITRQTTQQFFRDVFPFAGRGERDILTLLPEFLPEWGWRGSAEDFLALWLESERYVDPAICAMIVEVRRRGLTAGLATNQELRRARYMREVMKLSTLFDRLFISGELGAMKPQPEYFETVTTALGVEPNSILFIDDEERYTSAASAAGWQFIVHESNESTRAQLVQALDENEDRG
ncbi:MAG: HAD-IA family hydrolase [Deltaproteobacteria bacterium]|nr:HAD-IA family hydrolase [Deltaproteobacteria bacterium]